MKYFCKAFFLVLFICNYSISGIALKNNNIEIIPNLGHTGEINKVMYSPDGTLLASSGENVKLWDTSSGKLITTLNYSAKSISFNKAGDLLVIAVKNKIILYSV